MPDQKIAKDTIEDEQLKKKQEKEKQTKELYWILGGMATLIIVFVASYAYAESLKTFEYEGLTFKKESLGEIPLFRYTYSVEIPSRSQGVSLVTGNVINQGNDATKTVNVYLRNDPRENTVPFEGDEIEFFERRPILLSLETNNGLDECAYTAVGIGTLTNFLVQNNFEVKAGVSDEVVADENNLDFISCENNQRDTVIEIKTGEESAIVKQSPLCYELIIADCEVMETVEKLIVESIVDAKERSEING